jgi:hypothetical protein
MQNRDGLLLAPPVLSASLSLSTNTHPKTPSRSPGESNESDFSRVIRQGDRLLGPKPIRAPKRSAGFRHGTVRVVLRCHGHPTRVGTVGGRGAEAGGGAIRRRRMPHMLGSERGRDVRVEGDAVRTQLPREVRREVAQHEGKLPHVPVPDYDTTACCCGASSPFS